MVAVLSGLLTLRCTEGDDCTPKDDPERHTAVPEPRHKCRDDNNAEANDDQAILTKEVYHHSPL